MKEFDIVVIGGGPGGMTAAMISTQMGKSVALIQDEKDSFGGVCLNRGCMPTKSLLKAAKIYREAKQAAKYGLDLSFTPINLQRLRSIADDDLNQLRAMIQGMMSEVTPTIFRGKGSFESANDVLISKNDGSSEIIRCEKIIIATGSEPIELPFAPFDGRYILSSDQMLQNTELPEKLLIIGGGAIGCEFATMYHAFGSQVTVVEALDSLLPREDQEAGKTLRTAFEAQGIAVKTGTSIKQLTIADGQVEIEYENSDRIDKVDKVLVGVGRKPNISGLNLQSAGVATERGAVKVNSQMQTSIPTIYAVGDSNGGLMLAHAAEEEGKLLAMNLLQGGSRTLAEKAVPRVAFCHPEVAAVGISEATEGVKTFTMPQAPNGRSVVDKVTPAFIKLFTEEASSVIVGAIIVGEAATEMIHELGLAVKNRLTLQQIGETVHAHPTHSTNVIKAVHHFH